jgi:dynactin-6
LSTSNFSATSTFRCTCHSLHHLVYPPIQLLALTGHQSDISTMSSGSGSVRRQASAAPGPRPPCSIHPSAIISDKAVIIGTHPVSIGENVVLHPFARIVSNTGAVHIGKNCVVGDRATVGLSDTPGAFAGTTVELEESVSVESGSNVQAEKVGVGSTVEANSTLGPGVVVGKVSDRSGLVVCTTSVLTMRIQFCKITASSSIQSGSLPDFTIVYGGNSRRIDTTARTRPDVRDLKLKGQMMHIETLKRLVPSNTMKWLS